MAKKAKLTIQLVPEKEHTGTKYIVQKTKGIVEKMRFRKYDPVLRKHVWFVEKRMPNHNAK
jgi:large subunit ribosomal protein L33